MREFRQLATNVIHESPTNPRRSFSETSLDELTASVRPQAVRLIAERTAKLVWSPMLLRLLLEDIRPDDLFLELLGKPDRIAAKRYPQALAVALALRHAWQRDDLLMFSKRLGVKVTSKDLADTPASPTPAPEPPSAPTDRPRKSPTRR